MLRCEECGQIAFDSASSCPVCRSYRMIPIANADVSLRDALRYVNVLKPGAQFNQRDCLSYLADIAPSLKRERFILESAFRCGAVDLLGSLNEPYVGNAVQVMLDFGMNEDAVRLVVEAYGYFATCRPKGRDTQPETLYRQAVEHIVKNEIDVAFGILLQLAGREADGTKRLDLRLQPIHVPSLLLLSHLYHSRTPSVPLDDLYARRLWDEVESVYPSERWKQIGIDYDNKKCYSEALAFFLAHGEREGDSDSLFKASQVWLKKGCLKQALAALQLSSDIGSDKAKRFHRQLSSYSADEVRRHAYIDETPVE